MTRKSQSNSKINRLFTNIANYFKIAYLDIIILYLISIIGIFALFNNNNILLFFNSISSSFTGFEKLYDIIHSSVLIGTILILLFSFGPIFMVLFYTPVFTFCIFGTNSSLNKSRNIMRILIGIFGYILLLTNLIISLQSTFAIQFLFLTLILVATVILVKKCYSNEDLSKLLIINNLIPLFLVIGFYLLFVMLGTSIIGSAQDIHVDESLYMTIGRNFSFGRPEIQVSIYPTMPVILSIIIAFFSEQEFISFILIFIHGSLVIAGFLFAKNIFDDKNLAVIFSFILSISPLLILYSNRAFIDLIGLILFLITAEAVVKRRSPIFVST